MGMIPGDCNYPSGLRFPSSNRIMHLDRFPIHLHKPPKINTTSSNPLRSGTMVPPSTPYRIGNSQSSLFCELKQFAIPSTFAIPTPTRV
ncbi:hypothetical protein TNCT_141351 [Trichonephila clavata]|uniref:Uncharacterized protein n=1 Tax=Trichonephila clavata TaxID=2740835 RepID=A0A8X6GD61_TRICU|nr:hypothetical protein TNCT_141351 [Trichonephila clavata]